MKNFGVHQRAPINRCSWMSEVLFCLVFRFLFFIDLLVYVFGAVTFTASQFHEAFTVETF